MLPSASPRSPRSANAMVESLMKGTGFGQPRSRRSQRLRLWLPVAISFVIQVPPTIASVLWVEPSLLVGIATVTLSVLGPVLLIWVRRYPGPIVAILSVAGAADFLLGYSWTTPPYLALAFAVVIAISHGARTWTWVSMIVAWEGTLLAALLAGVALEPPRVVATTVGLLLVLGFAEANRRRLENFVQFQKAFTDRREQELREERVRIARELHDVLAHSLSQINVQAGVGLHLMHKQPEQAEAALASIKSSSKDALDEVRSLLGMLRNEDAAAGEFDTDAVPPVPEPDLSRLESLAASVRTQGLTVILSNDIPEQTPAAVQLALFRIAQESLTNVVRHAAATAATVRLVIDGDDYVATIADNGVGIDTDGHTAGRGLLGMRERAELLGGTLRVAEAKPRGTVVTARIPRRSASA
ncbi:sensor histidine kinase [Salinibacterium sp. NSLL150]|uniref:sensor histidine kinase n=1 Tax=unclassified Salinibacterium TaxID=2632331 RepID=UPI0018CF19E6|nr:MULTISPECIES: sensor histidine kinase [unclassified Salinibacterium]MBH0098950.1 sensor histidine kinase [Salinibacterium sp. NSLL35]MBH0101705.1 sensor histidine kinase [Salinibacterium sp. NSLL150]MBH0104464.1 sensor histidine kinase [Salinibacterium sp. NSLL16]MBH0107225.1 sensor histidine kinase [Salinibacterium sp. NSLL17]